MTYRYKIGAVQQQRSRDGESGDGSGGSPTSDRLEESNLRKLAEAIGMMGIRIEKPPADVSSGLKKAFSIRGVH